MAICIRPTDYRGKVKGKTLVRSIQRCMETRCRYDGDFWEIAKISSAHSWMRWRPTDLLRTRPSAILTTSGMNIAKGLRYRHG